MSIQSLGSQTIMQILMSGTPSKEVLAQVRNEVGAYSNNLEGYKDAFRFDYTNILNEINTTGDDQVKAQLALLTKYDGVQPAYSWVAKYSYYNKPNETGNLYTNLYSKEIAAIGNTCTYVDNTGSLIVDKDVNSPLHLVFSKNAIGKLFFSDIGLSLGGAIQQECLVDFATKVAQTELALKEYRIDNGSLPSTLNVLVPQFLVGVPSDPFDHKPIRYDVQKKILYSVGTDQTDLGGSSGGNWAFMKNPTFQIAF